MTEHAVPATDVRPTLQKRCPELAELLNDLDGFHKFVLARLRSFNLHNCYSPIEVANECIVRLHKALEKGQSIPNCNLWMRRTAIYVVYELSRATQKSSPYESSTLEGLMSPVWHETEEVDEQHHLIQRALQTLSSNQQELLELRFLQNLSWDDVAAFYSARGEKVLVATLRKRGQRAQGALRKAFLELVQE